jgi:hypothetical protein
MKGGLARPIGARPAPGRVPLSLGPAAVKAVIRLLANQGAPAALITMATGCATSESPWQRAPQLVP